MQLTTDQCSYIQIKEFVQGNRNNNDDYIRSNFE